MAITVASHVILLAALLPFLSSFTPPSITASQRRVILDVVVAVAVLAGVGAAVPWTRRRALPFLAEARRSIVDITRSPRRAAAMAVGAAGANLAYAGGLAAALAAFGPTVRPAAVLLVYLIAAVVAAIAPTPGGLGAMEAALVSGLTRIGVPGGQAVAATLAFRLGTFWIPLGVGVLALRLARARQWI
jgi:undecaprenyl-diphosphatase